MMIPDRPIVNFCSLRAISILKNTPIKIEMNGNMVSGIPHTHTGSLYHAYSTETLVLRGKVLVAGDLHGWPL